tara:strand:+ start:239 stop:610 length:372 start_codon:yes stop_codon:yes gene_type:complete
VLFVLSRGTSFYTRSSAKKVFKMVRKITMATVICFAITGCASPKAIGTIKESVLTDVEKCQFVTNVSGTSGWGGVAASSGISNAKEEAKQQAIDSGATHIVWQAVNGGFSPSVSANAYKCDKL